MESSPFHAHVCAALVAVLTIIGDAMRLGLDVPSPIVGAAEELNDETFRRAFLALREETATWSLPVDAGPGDDLSQYAWAVRRRDEAESVVVATRRVLAPRGTLPNELEEVRAFDAFLVLSDFTCGGRLGRADDASVRRRRLDHGVVPPAAPWVAACASRRVLSPTTDWFTSPAPLG